MKHSEPPPFIFATHQSIYSYRLTANVFSFQRNSFANSTSDEPHAVSPQTGSFINAALLTV
jgi:hypothetical protein